MNIPSLTQGLLLVTVALCIWAVYDSKRQQDDHEGLHGHPALANELCRTQAEAGVTLSDWCE